MPLALCGNWFVMNYSGFLPNPKKNSPLKWSCLFLSECHPFQDVAILNFSTVLYNIFTFEYENQ